MEPIAVLNLLSSGGVLAALLILIYLLLTRKLVTAREVEEALAANVQMREQMAALVVAIQSLTAHITELDRDIEELRHERGLPSTKRAEEPMV